MKMILCLKCAMDRKLEYAWMNTNGVLVGNVPCEDCGLRFLSNSAVEVDPLINAIYETNKQQQLTERAI